MFTFGEPLQRPWILTYEEKNILINKDITAKLQNPDIIAINFLHKKYCQKFTGCILNEEEGFSTQLQVSVFLNFLKQTLPVKQHICILVITPGYLIEKWCNRLENVGGYKVKMVDSTSFPEDFDQESNVALLLSFEDIKRAEILAKYHLSSVVIDHFDIVARKLVIKKVCGDFNIGITRRNFYINPDQKLQWTMLKWTNEMSVGKLMDYYEADNDNFANVRDNYHHWWLTLTWDYCDSFKRNLDEDNETQPSQSTKTKRRIYKRRKRKGSSFVPDEEKIVSITKDENDEVEVDTKNDNYPKISDEDSDKNQIKNPSDFQNTIEHTPDLDSYNDNVLMDIIENTGRQTSFETLDHESRVNLKKEELYSQIFSDDPPRDTNTNKSSEEYLLSLI